MVALLAYGKRDGKAVARRGERAGREGSVSARRIFQAIEIEHELTGFIETVGGEAGIEKAAGLVSGGGAGRVAKDEEKFGDGGIFEDWLKPKCYSRESEFRGTGDGLVVVCADQSGERNRLLRRVRNPLCGDAIDRVRRVPTEAAKTGNGWRMGIFDAKGEACFSADDIHVESADGETRRNFIFVSFCSQGLRFRRSPGYEKVSREPSRGWVQRNGFAFEVQDCEVRRPTGEMDLVVGSRANGIVSGLEPFEANKRKPAVGLDQVHFVFFAPGSGVFLPGGILSQRGTQKKPGQKKSACRSGDEASRTHTAL